MKNAGTAGTVVQPLSQKAFRRTAGVPLSQTLLHNVNVRFSIGVFRNFFYFYFCFGRKYYIELRIKIV